MVFRPEEVDGRSVGVGEPACLLGSLPDPEHDAPGFRSWATRGGRELHGFVAVMAAGPDLDRLSDHRRDTESVRRAARKAFRAVPQPDDKRRRGGREGGRDVDLTVAD